MKAKLLIPCFLIVCSNLLSQGFDDFYEHALEAHIVKSSPGYTSFGVQVAGGNVRKFGVIVEYTNLLIPDGITFARNSLSEKHPEKSNFTNIWGSVAVGVNVVSGEKIIVSAGANITDYWTMANKGANGGWYTAGTFVRADYRISDKFMLRVRNYLSQSFYSASSIFKKGTMLEGKPLFIKTGVDLLYGKRWTAGVEIINQLSDPQFNTSRINMRVGYRLTNGLF